MALRPIVSSVELGAGFKVLEPQIFKRHGPNAAWLAHLHVIRKGACYLSGCGHQDDTESVTRVAP